MALEQLPEYRRLITEATNPMALWIELHSQFRQLYTKVPANQELIRRFYQYARWCEATARPSPTEASTAVVCAFYEHLRYDDKIRADLVHWLNQKQLEIYS